MLELIKEIREQTGAGVVDVKKALDESAGDKDKALEILREQGLKKADKKADRIAGEGVIVSYIHADGKSGAMVKLLCETDFVAKNDKFKELANDIAMHVVAMSPVDNDELYAQAFVKNPEITIEELIKENIAAIGENIKVDSFVKSAV
jgi:elongation factor Ts